MAKMFYTLEEAAEKLGMDANQIKEMAAKGQIQQFRDRDKLMFKREQVDAMAAGGSSGSSISLSDDIDEVSLRSDDTIAHSDDSREATGVSVFDADEVEVADPAAQTQVTRGNLDDNDLALESVGSGSGLLDLTRESDDTSLGAELLDEIYPGSSGDTAGGSGAAVGSSGVFESAMASGTGQASVSGLGHLDAPTSTGIATQPATMVTYDDDGDDDPAIGTAGLLLGTTIALLITLIVATAHVVGLYSPLAQTMAADGTTLLIWTAGLLIGSAVLGLVGMGIGKAMAR